MDPNNNKSFFFGIINEECTSYAFIISIIKSVQANFVVNIFLLLWLYSLKIQKLQKCKIDQTGEFMQKYFQVFSWISQWMMEIQRPNISHFKAFDMTNLRYEIKVPQIDRGATIHYWAWYDSLRNRRYYHLTYL